MTHAECKTRRAIHKAHCDSEQQRARLRQTDQLLETLGIVKMGILIFETQLSSYGSMKRCEEARGQPDWQ